MPSRRPRGINIVRWEGVETHVNAQAAGTVAVVLRAAESLPNTVMRTRGELCGWVVGTPPLADALLCRWGMGVVCVPEGSGTTVVWSPLTDANAPWFVYASGFLGYQEPVGAAIQASAISSFRKEIDSKAMRKCPADMELQLVFENITHNGAVTIGLAFAGRILLGR